VKFFNYILLLFLFSTFLGFSQKKESKSELNLKSNKIFSDTINPLAPAKAAFYSAILPGLGQAYNKKYWKIPIVYAALGTGLYMIIDNNNKYDQFRTEYKKRIQGTEDKNDPTFSVISDASVLRGQRFYQKNRDLAILVTSALYVLNIIDANVDAHLLQFNVNDKLSFHPKIQPNSLNYKLDYVVSLSYNF
jgi:hypothetical protein